MSAAVRTFLSSLCLPVGAFPLHPMYQAISVSSPALVSKSTPQSCIVQGVHLVSILRPGKNLKKFTDFCSLEFSELEDS